MTAITTAARLLRVAADELKNAHTLGGDWGNEHEALDAYNEHMATATTLEHMARQCLAQIEEPAQPVAEICSASHDDAEFGERAIKPLCDISGFEYGTPLYAGAAPAAVTPALDVTLDEDQAGLLRDMLGDPAEYEDALTVRLIVCDGHSGHGLYVAQAEYQDEGAVLLTSLPAPAAPALEAPAAPQQGLAIPDDCPHIIWFDDHEMQPVMFAGHGARAAALEKFKRISMQWNAHLFVRIDRNSRDDRFSVAALAAAPQAPNCTRCSGSGEDPEGYLTHGRGPDDHTVDGPCRECDGTGAAPQAPAGLDELRKISEIAACWGCDHPDEPGDTELLRRVKWAARQLRAASQAPAAPTTCSHRIADARNPIVKSGYICIDCGALFSAADHGLAAPAAPAVDAGGDGWYLQDTRSYVGNDVLWWAKDGKGYTTDVSKAHVFTREEAFSQAAMRGVDRAWPKAYIDGKTRPAVDMQYINHDQAIAAQAAAKGADA